MIGPGTKAWLVRLLLAGAAAGLLAADGALDRAETAERATRVRLGSFISDEESADLLVAAVRLTSGDGRSFLFGRVDGVWRCLDLHRAPARESDVSALLESIRAAKGVVLSDDRAKAPDYGFDVDRTWTVTFHGPALMSDPDEDVRLVVEVGDARPTVDGCFLRRPGSDDMWAVDTDPRTLLDGGASHDDTALPMTVPDGLPPSIAAGPLPVAAGTSSGAPLLDPALVPAAFPGEGRTVVAVEVDRAVGDDYALVMQRREVTPEEQALGQSGIRWVLRSPDGGEQSMQPVLSVSYLSFLKVAPWEDILDPARLTERGLDRPLAQLTLRADDGRSLVLVVGPGGADGLHAVADVTLQCAYLVRRELVELLLPEPERLLFPGTNPWEPWLRVR